MPAPAPRRQLVTGAAALMVLAQLALRAWALYPSWFYTDDYRLLRDATVAPFDAGYLVRPFDSQFMPVGRALAAWVAGAGHLDWTLAATLTLVLQLLASTACVWMLFTLFEARRTTLVPLAFYLTCAVTMPATMWWAASLNQLPLQAVLFGSVAAWVTYLRSGRRRHLVLTALLLSLGLLSYVKTVLVFAVLVFVLLGYFCAGSPLHRARAALRTHWRAGVVLGVLGAGFSAGYVALVPQLYTGVGRDGAAGGLAASMLGRSLPTGLLGGPWHWSAANPPTAIADPPLWAVLVSWALLLGLAVAGARERRRTGRAWLLLAGYAGVLYLLTLTSRAQVVGGVLGYEYRYLTDLVPVATLVLGLVLMPVAGAAESSEPRRSATATAGWGRQVVGAVGAAVLVGGVLSSVLYARIWHQHNPGARYVHAVALSFRGLGEVSLADQLLPPDVVPRFSTPANTTSRLLPLVVGNARFPQVSSRLAVLDGSGRPHRALIDAQVTGTGKPLDGCGWRVEGVATTVTTTGHVTDATWWLHIGYLSSADDVLRVTAGGTSREAPVQKGLNGVYLHMSGDVTDVTLDLAHGRSVLCVDVVEIGRPSEGDPL